MQDDSAPPVSGLAERVRFGVFFRRGAADRIEDHVNVVDLALEGCSVVVDNGPRPKGTKTCIARSLFEKWC